MAEQQKEREYKFLQQVPGDPEKTETIIVKESELSPEQIMVMAQEQWKYFLSLPGPAQDLFLQRIDVEIARNQQMIEVAKNAAAGKSPGGIILPGNFGVKTGES